jgi:hypothetical protein
MSDGNRRKKPEFDERVELKQKRAASLHAEVKDTVLVLTAYFVDLCCFIVMGFKLISLATKSSK